MFKLIIFLLRYFSIESVGILCVEKYRRDLIKGTIMTKWLAVVGGTTRNIPKFGYSSSFIDSVKTDSVF